MVVALLVSGAVGGLLAGFFGVGGGIVMVPLLMIWARMNQRRAAATSLVAIVPTAIAGSITFGIAGEVNWVVAALIGAGAIAGAPLARTYCAFCRSCGCVGCSSPACWSQRFA